MWGNISSCSQRRSLVISTLSGLPFGAPRWWCERNYHTPCTQFPQLIILGNQSWPTQINYGFCLRSSSRSKDSIEECSHDVSSSDLISSPCYSQFSIQFRYYITRPHIAYTFNIRLYSHQSQKFKPTADRCIRIRRSSRLHSVHCCSLDISYVLYGGTHRQWQAL